MAATVKDFVIFFILFSPKLNHEIFF